MTTESITRTARPRARVQRTAPRRLAIDRAASWIVTGGGLAIVASILGILAFILLVVWPLMKGARVEPGPPVGLATSEVLALVGDEHRTHVVTLSRDGLLRAFRTRGGEQVAEWPALRPAPESTGPGPEAAAPTLLGGHAIPGEPLFAAATSDGRVGLLPVGFAVTFEGQERVVTPERGEPIWLTVAGPDEPIVAFTGRLGGDDQAMVAAQLAGGELAVVQRTATRNLLTGEVAESLTVHRVPSPEPVTHLVMDGLLRTVFAGASNGTLLKWDVVGGAPRPARARSAGTSPVTALSLLIGDNALIVGQQDGSLSIWFKVRTSEDETLTDLVRVRDFDRRSGAVRLIAPSMRNKGFVAWDETGELGLHYSTSHRTLWQQPVAHEARALTLSPKADGAYLAGDGELLRLDIDNPHPEVSWKALFGRVWYESYEGPEYVWQSTGGTDDFESKMSLTPLLVGTLKGTIYSLLLAIPLGVFGAMYASQFMHPKLLRFVKPTVEVMAALPSVVLGFLAGLWLAPRLEAHFPALILAVLLLPPMTLAAGAAWQTLPRRLRGALWTGTEALFFLVVLACGLWLCVRLSRPVEVALFGGSFQAWALETLGLGYDQRNAVVIGLAMGFAVVPIIFAISEDAFSNVPRNLVAGSLALGANRWQTVSRVVLPSASPGIFSAIMIGFGRAVGETMIVLMATGNTPIMDWNPFNGFRTLSANIAVEIPEAPHGGTLYRVLFLAALLLFATTFLINTVAEIVRQRLRKRYSEL